MLITGLTNCRFPKAEDVKKSARLVEHLRVRRGDMAWTLGMLSTLSKQTNTPVDYFEPGWVAPPRHQKKATAA